MKSAWQVGRWWARKAFSRSAYAIKGFRGTGQRGICELKVSIRLSIIRLPLIAVIVFSGGLLAHAERPADSDLLPLLQSLAKSPFLGHVLNGPRVPGIAQINHVQIKILQIQDATLARDRTAWAPEPYYKVWPIRLHAVVSYTVSGRKNASSGEGACYAYRDGEDKWAVTAFPPEIKKTLSERIWDSILGNGRGT